MSDTRPIPDAAIRDAEAVEMLRAWIAERGLHCSLKVGMYVEQGIDEERAWGIMLADVARHVSRALHREYGHVEADSIRRIRDSMLEELGEPTSEATGKFV